MSAINKPTTSHRFEYAVLRCVEVITNILPRRIALALGATAGRALHILSVHKKIVLKNFEHVGIWDKKQAGKIILKLYRNMGRYAVDFLRKNGKLPPHRLHDYDIYTTARTTGKGTIIVLAHFGNWELLAAIWGRQVNDLNVVAKPMRNPLVEAWLLKKRTALAVKTIHTDNALRGMLGALRRDGITAILIDQYLGKAMGTPAPFLGKTASTVRTVAGLARKTGATAVPVCAIMDRHGAYGIRFFKAETPVLDNDGDSGKVNEEAMINAIQAQHNDILSQWIIENPEHWFGWFHKRFKEYVNYA